MGQRRLGSGITSKIKRINSWEIKSSVVVFNFRGSGRNGRVNWNLGVNSIAVLFFTSDERETGKGYEMTITRQRGNFIRHFN